MDLGLPLTGGMLQRLPQGATLEQTTGVINNIVDTLNGQLKSQVFADGSTKRYLSGYQKGGFPGGDFGMKISKPGKDVTSATTEDLLFIWDFTTGHTYHYGGTEYWYDPLTRINYMQEGVLPDGTGGIVVAEDNTNVQDAF